MLGKRDCWALLAAVAVLASCAATPGGLPPPPPAYAPPPRISFAAGDTMDLKFFYTPELNEPGLMVRPDGKIALQLVGEVAVQGRSPEELAAELSRLYAPHLKRPEVAVIVRTLTNRRVYVGGEVRTPGLVPLPGRLTALEAIMEVGGPVSRTAALSTVLVIRHDGNQRRTFCLDLSGFPKGEAPEPFFLEPFDVVYVPMTKIAQFNDWVDMNINRIVPDFGLQFTRQTGDWTIGVDTFRR